MIKKFDSYSLAETQVIGVTIAQSLKFPACIYLAGDLGAGKTTLCQTIINELGYSGIVTSPTYNLIQEYRVGEGVVYHMDLYRLQDEQELEYLALADLWSPSSLFLIEWPDKGGRLLPKSTHKIEISNHQNETDSFRKIIFMLD